MEPRDDALRQDLDAAIQTRKELGKEYETEVIDSFLARLDARLDARVERRVERRVAEALTTRGPGRPGPARRGGFPLPVFSLIMAIPLSAITSEKAGVFGLLVAWAGIVGVNLAAAVAGRRDRGEEVRRRTAAWD